MTNTLIGRHKSEIDIPALLLYIDVAEENIRRMADYFKDKECKLRPHMKTHKLPLIAKKQLEAGAIGITCAKLGEAQVFLDSGIEKILIANEVAGQTKIKRLVELSRNRDLIVCVDNYENARQISEVASNIGNTVNALVEINVGLDRCGVAPGKPALELVQKISKLKKIAFRGLMGYEGGVFTKDPEEKAKKCRDSNRLLVETRGLVEKNGFPVDFASAGGSNTYLLTGNCPGITDVQVGSYVTMDDHCREYGLNFGQAVTVMATVLSRPDKTRAVMDAGKKSLSTDEGLPRCIDTDLSLFKLNEEHGHLRINHPDRTISAGDQVEIVPRHGCTTIPLFDRYFIIRNEHVEEVVEMHARGANQ